MGNDNEREEKEQAKVSNGDDDDFEVTQLAKGYQKVFFQGWGCVIDELTRKPKAVPQPKKML